MLSINGKPEQAVFTADMIHTPAIKYFDRTNYFEVKLFPEEAEK